MQYILTSLGLLAICFSVELAGQHCCTVALALCVQPCAHMIGCFPSQIWSSAKVSVLIQLKEHHSLPIQPWHSDFATFGQFCGEVRRCMTCLCWSAGKQGGAHAGV